MANGAWSNDQLTSLFIYNDQTGALILRVDKDGFYFTNSANGSYVRIQTDNTNQSASVLLRPKDSSYSTTYSRPGKIAGGERAAYTPANISFPTTRIESPTYTGKAGGAISIEGSASGRPDNDDISQLYVDCESIYGREFGIIGNGTIYFSDFFATDSFTGSEKVIDYCQTSDLGDVNPNRMYEYLFNLVAYPTNLSDRFTFSVKQSDSYNSLVNPVSIYSYGTYGSVACQPIVIQGNTGSIQPNKYLVLTGRRTSGTGTISCDINYRKLADICYLS